MDPHYAKETFYGDELIESPDPTPACEIETAFGVRTIKEIAANFRCLGVTRFIVSPESISETIITFVWSPHSVLIDYARGRTSFADGDTPFDARQAHRWQGKIPLLVLPRLFRGYRRLKTEVLQAPSCRTFSFGGQQCWHRLFDCESDVFSYWFNPRKTHVRQSAIICAYLPLVVAGHYFCWLPSWSVAARKQIRRS